MAPAELLVSVQEIIPARQRWLLSANPQNISAIEALSNLAHKELPRSSSPVTPPTDTQIDVKTCSSEEVPLENASLDLVSGKNCTGTDG